MVTQATEINTDPSCSRAVDPDMALGGSLDIDVTMAAVAIQVTQIGMVLGAAWPSDTNTVSGG